MYIRGGVLFGTVYGGVIFPPYYLPYFPPPIVTVRISEALCACGAASGVLQDVMLCGFSNKHFGLQTDWSCTIY